MFRIRLKTLREEKGLSQAAFAKDFGVAQSTVGGWEAGTREPNFDTVQKLADYFDVSVDYLLCRTNESKITDTTGDTIDVQERLQEILSQLEGKDALMFSGDPLSDDSKELLAAALERAIRLAHKANKSEDDVNEG